MNPQPSAWICGPRNPAGVLLLALSFATLPAPGESKIEFNRDVRPILSENCFRCHGPDKNQRKAKLRLDVREVALEREAFVPGKPDDSELVRRIFTSDPDDVMPKPSSQKTLTAAQKDLLRRWIAEGAEYQPHWAYITPTRPAVPKLRNPKSEIRNPIDAFVRQALETRGIQLSPEADRRTLLRRLALDLIGLPPTPQEMDAFLKDKSPRAYEKQVDRLLASPHFGERMAVPWLDVVRFSDTVGYHGDQNQNIFPYRDYVINAFNANKPFDQFTLEQIAGDLLPNPATEQRVATAFNRLNMMTREGGAQPKEYLAKYQADRVRTVSAAWLGSTMGCCECHDHKFDPFTTKDFYQMEAFFADVRQWGVYADYGYTPNPDLKGFGNEHPFAPEIEVESPYLRARIGQLNGKLEATQSYAWEQVQSDEKVRADFAVWRAAGNRFFKAWPDGWSTPPPEVALKLKDDNASAATNFNVEADGTVRLSRKTREGTTLSLPLTNQWLAAIRLQVAPHESEGEAKKSSNSRKRKAGDIALSAKLATGTNDQKLTIYFADADHKETRFSMGLAILGVKDLWRVSAEHELQTGVWLLDKPVQVTGDSTLTVNLGGADVAAVRVSVSPFAANEPLNAGGGEALRRALRGPVAPRAASARALAEKTYLLSTTVDPRFLARARELQREIRECRSGRVPVQITEAREPMVTRVLPRGNWQDESGDIVQPAPPHFLPLPANPDGRRLTRLDLARWLVSPANPLTARTVVNRLWRDFFGRGLAPVVDDLGAQSEPPSHPDLLDWLACEFMQPSLSQTSASDPRPPHAWDVKHVVKTIVMSATYRQASGPRPDLKDVDPNNRLLACQSPRRLEAEFVRDNALAIAGLLNPEVGGPSAHPYQPPGYYANIQFPDRDYYPEKDDRQYRRGVYAWWQRTFLQPMMANFDAPSREECTATRVVSNTPQQALSLLNDPSFVEASRVLAARMLAARAGSDEERLDLAFQRALNRPMKPAERESLVKFLAAQRKCYDESPDDAKKLLRVGVAANPRGVNDSELAAWTQVCRVVLNLHETITKY